MPHIYKAKQLEQDMCKYYVSQSWTIAETVCLTPYTRALSWFDQRIGQIEKFSYKKSMEETKGEDHHTLHQMLRLFSH